MTRTITLKVTQEEADLLEWFRRRINSANLSDALREALLVASIQKGLCNPAVREIREARDRHPPRKRLRSPVISDGEVVGA